MDRIHNNAAQKQRRRALRNNPTPAEKALWNCLKGRKLNGRKFRRQHGIGPYIVDFYCPSEQLVIELDGASHDAPNVREYDATRQRFLEKKGFRVVRFSNGKVLAQLSLVCEAIEQSFER